MSTDSDRMPPIAAVQTALRRITESLAAGLASSSAGPPEWSGLEWRLAPAVAAIHGISSLLAGALRSQGPPHWASFLAEQRQHTLLRQQRIDELLAAIDESARSAGIAVIALKGTALQRAGVYAPGERPMADIDLLVHPADVDTAVALLLALSYREAGATWKHRALEPRGEERSATLGEHADNPIKIDLHHRLCERLPLALTDLTDLVCPPDARPGLNYPGETSLLTHVLAHAAGNMVCRSLRLIQLHDIVRLAQRLSERDWEHLARLHGSRHRLWWSAPPLLLAARYAPGIVPGGVLARLERGCPLPLRRAVRRRTLTDFSPSHVHIDPAPGILWVRSPMQALRYLGSRAFPSREQREQMRFAATTGPFSAHPQWLLQSHTRRILQWLLSRPTRTATLQPVLAALARAE